MPDGEVLTKDFPVWKTPYNHDTNWESDRTALYCKDASLTKQEFVEDSDINVILERFTKTGEPPPTVLPEDFADMTTKRTYLDIQEQLAAANRLFYEQPAEIRNAAQNNVAIWADQVMRAMQNRDGDRLNQLGVALEERDQAKPKAAPAAPAAPPPAEKGGDTKAAGEPPAAKT